MKKEECPKNRIDRLKHHTRRLSIKEGIFWSARRSFGDLYIAPFAIMIGTLNPLVVIINSLFSLSSISQLIGSKLLEKFKRKAILTKAVLIDSFGWFLMALIGFFYYKGILINLLPYFILVDLSLILFSSGIGNPAWFSLMGDVVDKKFRGRWFSKRNTILSFSIIVLTIFASLILESFKNYGKETIGFIFLFLIAGIARFISSRLLKKHYDKKLKIKNQRKNKKFRQLFNELKNSNLGKFILFRGMFSISVGITVPIVSIYLLRYLKLDYLTYIAIILSGTLFSIFSLNLWGKMADKFGNYKIIAITTFLIPITPLLWIVSSSPIYLFFVPAILGGTTWSAFVLASGNFLYDNTNREKRAKAFSYFGLFVGIGSFIGGLIAAYLMNVINTSWIKPIYLIFLIGFFARIVVVAFWIPKLKEIKKKENLKKFKDFSNTILHEAKPTLVEDMHEIFAIKEYLEEK